MWDDVRVSATSSSVDWQIVNGNVSRIRVATRCNDHQLNSTKTKFAKLYSLRQIAHTVNLQQLTLSLTTLTYWVLQQKYVILEMTTLRQIIVLIWCWPLSWHFIYYSYLLQHLTWIVNAVSSIVIVVHCVQKKTPTKNTHSRFLL